MSDDAKKRAWAWIWWMIVLLPAIYVLSIGPMGWLTYHGYVDMRWYVTYEPLDWACLHSATLQRFAAWYLRFWI
jgi:hypothetical protein